MKKLLLTLLIAASALLSINAQVYYPVQHLDVPNGLWSVRNWDPGMGKYGRRFITVDSTQIHFQLSRIYMDSTVRNLTGVGQRFLTLDSTTNKLMLTGASALSLKPKFSEIVAGLGYTPLSTEVDGSTTNEIQTLSINTNTVSISGGNSITIPSQTLSVSSNSLTISSGNTVVIPDYNSYTNTATTTTGVATFYLTSDKTSSGTALYTSVNSIIPMINDANGNYSYGWTVSGDLKTLTITAKIAAATNIPLLGLSLLAPPANVADGTSVIVLVKGTK